MNLVEEIRRDHRYLSDLLTDLCNANNGETRARNYGNATQRIMAHEQAEEETLYDALGRDEALKDEILTALSDHASLKNMVVQLRQDTTPGNIHWKPRICRLREAALDHMKFEEEQILPRAENNLSELDLDLLGRQYVSSMKELQELEPLPRS